MNKPLHRGSQSLDDLREAVETRHERRRTTRCFFGGVAEVAEQQSGRYLIGEAGNLSLFGCFVKTKNPFAIGALVNLKITHGDKSLACSGRVVFVLADKGMGVAFDAIPPEQASVLQNWLS